MLQSLYALVTTLGLTSLALTRYVHACTCTHSHSHTHALSLSLTHAHTHIHTHTHPYTHTHTHMCTCTHSHSLTHARTHTCAHTQVPHVTRISTLIAKAVGVLFSVAGGESLFYTCTVDVSDLLKDLIINPLLTYTTHTCTRTHTHTHIHTHTYTCTCIHAHTCTCIHAHTCTHTGFFVGKEGPMIHSGAIIGAGVPQFRSMLFKRLKLPYPYFRSDR